MVEVVAQFFGLIGLDMVPPSNMQELIPYLLCIFVGVVLVTSVYRIISGIAKLLMDRRKFD